MEVELQEQKLLKRNKKGSDSEQKKSTSKNRTEFPANDYWEEGEI